MTYYKGLNPDGSCYHGGHGAWPLPARNTDGSWTPGEWVEVEGKVEACVNGLHACRDRQVLEWLGPALFELEYDGEPVDAGNKVVGRKARLVRRFESWNERTARLFACDCAERALPAYERSYPEDARPRMAVETARRYADGHATADELAAASWDAGDAARVATGGAAWAAAWAAVRAASWCPTEVTVMDAVWAAVRDAELNWQYERLLHYLFEKETV